MVAISAIFSEMAEWKKKNAADMVKTNERLKEMELARTNSIKDQRNQHYGKRAEAIQRTEHEKCMETARLFKDLEKHSFSGPFFDKLLDILKNHQGLF